VTSTSVPAALRRAALSIHALEPADRDWILASLPAEERDSLGVLLQELQDLGIAPDALPHDAGTDPQPEGSTAGLAALQDIDLARLAKVLRAEPPIVIAALLAAHAWPWRERLLALMPTCAGLPAIGPGEAAALQTAVLLAVQQRMRAPASGVPAARQSAWKRIFVPRGLRRAS